MITASGLPGSNQPSHIDRCRRRSAQRRQWTLVEDFASGVDTVLRHGVIGEIYNIGNPEAGG